MYPTPADTGSETLTRNNSASAVFLLAALSIAWGACTRGPDEARDASVADRAAIASDSHQPEDVGASDAALASDSANESRCDIVGRWALTYTDGPFPIQGGDPTVGAEAEIEFRAVNGSVSTDAFVPREVVCDCAEHDVVFDRSDCAVTIVASSAGLQPIDDVEFECMFVGLTIRLRFSGEALATNGVGEFYYRNDDDCGLRRDGGDRWTVNASRIPDDHR
jgi:hypothetical protein